MIRFAAGFIVGAVVTLAGVAGLILMDAGLSVEEEEK